MTRPNLFEIKARLPELERNPEAIEAAADAIHQQMFPEQPPAWGPLAMAQLRKDRNEKLVKRCEEIVRGGQGRSARSVFVSAWIVCVCLGLAAFAAIGVLAWMGAGR